MTINKFPSRLAVTAVAAALVVTACSSDDGGQAEPDFYDEGRRIKTHTWADAVVEGSRGQPLLNPLLRRLAHVEQQILALEDRFGMNPRARLKMGVALGAPQATLEDLRPLALVTTTLSIHSHRHVDEERECREDSD